MCEIGQACDGGRCMMFTDREPDAVRHRIYRSGQRLSALTAGILAIVGGFVLFLLVLVLTGHLWRAIAYATVVLFAALGVLAVYFWGALLLGSLVERITNRRTAESWDIGLDTGFEMPQHDIDPGLELLAAGMLTYRLGEVRPRAHFRTVQVDAVRAVRPFVVARTGAARPYRFEFVLSDDAEVTRFADTFAVDLQHVPQLVVPPYRLLVQEAHKLIGQRWLLQVRTGVTVITSLRFVFVDGSTPVGEAEQASVTEALDAAAPAWQASLLPKLLDEALKREALTRVEEIVLEVV